MTENNIQPLNQEQVLVDAIQMRQNEILMYQINIDNYQSMLDTPYEPTGDADFDAEMLEYRDKIAELLKSEKREQAKSKMVLTALETQLANFRAQSE